MPLHLIHITQINLVIGRHLSQSTTYNKHLQQFSPTKNNDLQPYVYIILSPNPQRSPAAPPPDLLSLPLYLLTPYLTRH